MWAEHTPSELLNHSTDVCCKSSVWDFVTYFCGIRSGLQAVHYHRILRQKGVKIKSTLGLASCQNNSHATHAFASILSAILFSHSVGMMRKNLASGKWCKALDRGSSPFSGVGKTISCKLKNTRHEYVWISTYMRNMPLLPVSQQCLSPNLLAECAETLHLVCDAILLTRVHPHQKGQAWLSTMKYVLLYHVLCPLWW